jgi:hypothetical protein
MGKLTSYHKLRLAKERDPEFKKVIRETFYADFETGLLYYKVPNKAGNPRNRKQPGDVAGTTKSKKGYPVVQISVEGSYPVVKVHRIIWFLYYGEFPSDILDHVNGVKDDNRIVNLRESDDLENSRNMLITGKNTSGFRGVSRRKDDRKWRACIRDPQGKEHLGYFDDPKDAFRARVLREVELWGALSVGTASCIREHEDLTEEFKHLLLESSTSPSEEKGSEYEKEAI